MLNIQNIRVMKKNILVIGVLAMVMLGTETLLAQRGRQDRRDRQERDRFERRDDRRGGRNGRREKVVDRRFVRYDGYRGSSYGPVRGPRGRDGFRRGYRPSKRHIWIAGHYRYSRRLGRDVWRDGYWVVRNDRHHRWVPGHYIRRRGVRVWIPGCWVRF